MRRANEHTEALVEQQQESTGVSRGQNQLHVLPEDAAAAAQVIQPLLDRLDASATATQMVVITSDADAAAGIAARLADARSPLRVIAATESRRATRVLRKGTPHVIVAAAEQLGALLRAATLKLDAVRVVVFAWSGGPAIDAVMADVPKDAARLVLTGAVSAEVEQLLERYAWRARRVQPAAAEPGAPVSLSHVVTSEAGREGALRRVLDALDPDAAFVYAKDAGSRATVETSLRSLGYGAASDGVRVGSTPEGAFDLLVFYDLPSRDDELRAIVRDHGSARFVAIVSARQLEALRSLAGGSVTPLALPDAAVRARSREDRLRDEIRAVLDGGQFAREVLSLEPLLADHDGIEVAAAVLRLLEGERAKARTPQLQSAPAGVTRLYLNVGSMDDVRPGDLVGAITNEAGIAKSELGRVDVRDRHSTVEVASSVANAVVGKLTGLQIKGRRVIARVDEDKPRERPRRSGGDRGERRGPPRGAGRDRERPPRPPRDRPRRDA